MAKKASVTDIVQAYKQLVAEGTKNPSKEQLMEAAKATEKAFDEYFDGPDEVGRKAWSDYAATIQKQTESSEAYQAYGAREKMIAYFFSLFEIMAPDRAFVGVTYCNSSLITDYRLAFRGHMQQLVDEGIVMGDLVDRFQLSQYYTDILWGLHQQLVGFWLKDESEDFTATERAIEVYSKVPLEFMGHNLVDSVIESVTFAIENLKLDRLFR